jgi:hypothetical protein
MPKYLVKTVKIFTMDYVIEARDESHASDEIVTNDDIEEVSQKYISNDIIYSNEISNEDIIKLFNKEYPNMSDKEILNSIHKIKYDDWKFS